MGCEKPPREEAGQQTQEREMIEWLRLSFSFEQSDFCLALSCIDWVVPALSLFSSPLFSSLLSFLLFYSPLFSSPLSVDLVATSLSHCSLSLSPFASVLSPSLSIWLVWWPHPCLARSLSCIGWVAVSISCVGWVASLSFSCAGWITFPLSVSLSLSLLSLVLVGWLLLSRVFVRWFLPSHLLLCVGWVVSALPFLSIHSLLLLGWLLAPPSLSLSLFLSLVLVGWGLSFLWWLGGFSAPLSCVVGRRLLSLSLSLPWLSLSLRLF